MTDESDVLPLEALDPFGWIFTSGPAPRDAISATEAGYAVGSTSTRHSAIVSGVYTEKGRYRRQDGRRVTLYYEHPVWLVTSAPSEADGAPGRAPQPEQYSRHTLVDARTGKPITQFLLVPEPAELGALDLHDPLDVPELSPEEAVDAAISGEEPTLAGLPTSVEYGSRWRLIPGFIQVTDVWRVTFDTSSLPPMSPTAAREIAWVVVVDDKAGHRWLSAAVETKVANSQ